MNETVQPGETQKCAYPDCEAVWIPISAHWSSRKGRDGHWHSTGTARPEDLPTLQKFTIAVYDEEGGVVLFRQVEGYGGAGVLQQLAEQMSAGNHNYGMTDAVPPVFVPVPRTKEEQ